MIVTRRHRVRDIESIVLYNFYVFLGMGGIRRCGMCDWSSSFFFFLFPGQEVRNVRGYRHLSG